MLKIKRPEYLCLRVITVFVSLLLPLTLLGQQIQWLSIEQALELQKNEPKKIFMDVYTDWCGPCKMMDILTFSNRDVIEYVNKNFYPVKFNGEGNEEFEHLGIRYSNPQYVATKRKNKMHEFAQYLGVQGYPVVIFLNEKSEPILPVMGMLDPAQLELYLKFVNSNDYLSVNNEQQMKQYVENFQHEFETFKGL
ncbi:MAG: thioredoxin fold domain-containing protein [Flavobacteriaceae bacterium]|nr:thioredoxin fold domain-containing protein [Flavobacteriaceae bacterium]MCY4253472.1 thioredoxin fold domain-containing protein [Flavobacteriaceae bacterium]